MSHLGETINAATDSTVSTEQLLSKLQVVAYRTGSDPLKMWLDREINGYTPDEDPLPPYRKNISVPLVAEFAGIGGIRKELTLSQGDIPSSSPLAQLFNPSIYQSVSELESLLGIGSREVFGVQAPLAAVVEYRRLAEEGKIPGYTMMQVQTLTAQITPAQVQGIVSKIRNAALKFLLELESQLPDVGDSPIHDAAEKRKVEETVGDVFNVTIYGGQNNLGMGGKAVQHVKIAQGDTSALDRELRNLGVEPDEAAALIDEFLNGSTESDRKTGAKKALAELKSGAIKVAGKVITPENYEFMKQLLEQWIGGSLS